MSALDDLRNKKVNTQVELCILYWGDPVSASDENIEEAEQAAAELLTLRERVEKMAVVLQWIYDDGEGGTYRPDIQAVLVAHNQASSQ